jgi:hypothetical protein
MVNLPMRAIELNYHCILHGYPHQDGDRSSTASKMVVKMATTASKMASKMVCKMASKMAFLT